MHSFEPFLLLLIAGTAAQESLDLSMFRSTLWNTRVVDGESSIVGTHAQRVVLGLDETLKTPLSQPGRVCVPKAIGRYNVTLGGNTTMHDASTAETSFDIALQMSLSCFVNVSSETPDVNVQRVDAVSEEDGGLWAYEMYGDVGDYLTTDTTSVVFLGVTAIWIHMHWNDSMILFAWLAPLLAIAAVAFVSWRMYTTRAVDISRLFGAVALTTLLTSTLDRLYNAFVSEVGSREILLVFVLCVIVDGPVLVLATAQSSSRLACATLTRILSFFTGVVALFALGSGYFFGPVFLIISAVLSLVGVVCCDVDVNSTR